ncbi:cytochrome c biogenesis CcdA family protein [Haloglycomyces albus]|uniref:cytochrome c biogenesis CcdA family protein n=1 Tax=Haloglycomyces albus TaxID=526067 RepID=UPI00046CF746|nr:cytochrome c biogenesis protein CcdA [Haloglycomyces albus]
MTTIDLASGFADVAGNGPLLAAVAVAALAGLVAFLSPCTLPLMPGYVAYITGLSGSDLSAGRKRGRVLLGSTLFVLGFSAVYTATNFALQSVGRAFLDNSTLIERVGGLVMIAMGLLFIGLIPLGRGFQMRWRPAMGLAGAPLFGAVFALSWLPCVSPVLVAIVSFSYTQEGTGRGAALMLAYCLGIGIPFIIVAVGLHRLAGAMDFFKRHGKVISAIGGVMLIAVGLLLTTGEWTGFINWMRGTFGTGVGLI